MMVGVFSMSSFAAWTDTNMFTISVPALHIVRMLAFGIVRTDIPTSFISWYSDLALLGIVCIVEAYTW